MATNERSTDAPTVREDVHELTARLSTTGDGTTVCTIYPADTGAESQTTRWICAEDGSFVNAEDYR